MATLVNMWQGYHPAALEEKQMPLIVDDNLAVSTSSEYYFYNQLSQRRDLTKSLPAFVSAGT